MYGVKRCRTCKKRKPLDQFKKNNRKPDGYDTICKACYRVANRRYNLDYRLTPAGAAALAWNRIVYRCGNRNGDFPAYQDVENRFTRSAFIDWAIPAYEAWIQNHGTVIGASVDRIRSTGHYEPGNVRLITLGLNTSLASRHRKALTAQRLAARTFKTCLRTGLDVSAVISELTELSKNNKKPATSFEVAGK